MLDSLSEIDCLLTGRESEDDRGFVFVMGAATL
jgi:hypothetical protein